MAGQVVCFLHGGRTKRALNAAKRRIALAEVTQMLGIPIDVDPAEALIQQVHLAAGNEVFLRHQVQLLQDGDIDAAVTPDGIDVRVKLWNEERERLAKMSKLAVDAGIAERQVRMKEAEGAAMAAILVTLIDSPELGLSGLQRAAGRQLARRLLLAQLAAKRPTVDGAPGRPDAGESLLIEGEFTASDAQERNG